MSSFELAIGTVLENEGGYVNNLKDPGGETKYGISQRCLPPDTRILTADLNWVELGSLFPGQELLAFDEVPERRGKLNIRRFKHATVEAVTTVVLPSSRITTNKRELIAGDDHQWLRRWGKPRVFNWCKTRDLLKARGKWTNGVEVCIGSAIAPWIVDNSRDAGYLAAVLDGEGCISASDIAFSQKTGNALVQQAYECASRIGLSIKRGNERNGVSTYHFVNAARDPHFALQLAGRLGATRLLHVLSEALVGKNVASTYAKHDVVIDVEPVGKRELIGLSTSTRTVIAEGLLTHNSYPNLDIKNLTRDEAIEIYQRDFWKFDGVNDQRLATKIFDAYVNMGHTAIKLLQKLLGQVQDGVWGPNTQAAVNSRIPELLLQNYRDALVQHYQDIVDANPAEIVFLPGWIIRARQ